MEIKNLPTARHSKKTIFVFIFVLLLITGFFVFKKTWAEEKFLIVTEIMYNPEGTDTGQTDWLEIYNPTDKEIAIKKEDFGLIDEEDLRLGKDGEHYLNCHKIKSNLEVPPGKYVILADDKEEFEDHYLKFSGSDLIDGTFSLSSNGDTLHLSQDRCKTFFAEFSYDKSWGGSNNGRTLEKKKLDYKYGKKHWQESYVPGGTPGQLNSEKPQPEDYAFDVYINEIFPAPNEENKKYNQEYIELFNNEKKKIDLSNWILKDASKTGSYTLPENSIISAKDFLVVYKKDFGFSLNNSGDEYVRLINPAEVTISKIKYNGSQKEYSYSRDGSEWRWSSKPTPKKKNKFDKKLSGKINLPKKIYKDIYAEFSVKADKDAEKFTWDFGDEHKSYLKETRHKYEKTGKYKGSLRIRGNGEEALYKFTIKVEKYKAPDIEIISLCPNPQGKDSENEWLEIKNNSSDDVNLKNWSVATGWENLYNHPIREDFEIEEDEFKKLGRDVCAFSLNNSRAKIELRDPTGKVVQEIKYDREKNKIQDDEIYKKQKDYWVWLAPQNQNKKPNPAITLSENNFLFIEKQTIDKSLLGKYSVASFWENKIKKRKEIINYGINIKLAKINLSEKHVLGTEKIKENKNYFSFTRNISTKHWFLSWTENIWFKINFQLNKLFLNLSF